MSVLENTPCEDKCLVSDLAHRVREVAYSVIEVVYKMSVLENRVDGELLAAQPIQRGADGESAAIDLRQRCKFSHAHNVGMALVVDEDETCDVFSSRRCYNLARRFGLSTLR